MNAHQRAIQRRIDKQKRQKENEKINEKIIESIKNKGGAYFISDGKVVEIEVDNKVPPLQKRAPITINVPKTSDGREEEPFHVSNEMFQDLVRNFIRIFGTH